jgi:hypothetical protein
MVGVLVVVRVPQCDTRSVADVSTPYGTAFSCSDFEPRPILGQYLCVATPVDRDKDRLTIE